MTFIYDMIYFGMFDISKLMVKFVQVQYKID